MRVAPAVLVAAITVMAGASPLRGQAGAVPSDGLDTVRFAPHLGVDLAASRRTPSGARWREVAAGSGHAPTGVYFGTLRMTTYAADGAVVGGDSTVTFTVKVGYGILMPGLDEALAGMRVGARRRVVLPLAAQGDAGRTGMPGVPPGAPLVIDVELLRISDRADP